MQNVLNGIDLASSTTSFIFVSLLELLFLLGAAIYFKIKKLKIQKEFKHRIKTPRISSKKQVLKETFIGASFGVILLLVGMAFQVLVKSLVVAIAGSEFYNDATSGSVNTIPEKITFTDLLITSTIMFTLVAFCEEFFFRALIFRDLRKKVSQAAAIIISSSTFAIYHVMPGIVPLQTFITFFPYYFFIGILLCLLYEWRNNSLLTVVIAHGFFNTIILILQFLF
ncbi:MAG: lysostaphin resistance A-like protein [Promethearchaeota archaeon]